MHISNIFDYSIYGITAVLHKSNFEISEKKSSAVFRAIEICSESGFEENHTDKRDRLQKIGRMNG